MFLKKYFFQICYAYVFLIKKVPLNDLNLIYCKFHIAQIIIIEDIDNIIKGALEVVLSVHNGILFYLYYILLGYLLLM